MSLFLSWMLFVGVQLLATLTPGPAFVMEVRNALAYGRRAGVITALGLGVGVGFYVVLVLCGLALVVSKSLFLYNLIKYVGAAYLVYVGVKGLMTRKKVQDAADVIHAPVTEKHMSDKGAFLAGVLTNVLNPKAVIFFTAVFTQFIHVDTPFAVQFLYGVTSVAIEILCFVALAFILTKPAIRARFMAVLHWVERGCGGLMVALGVKLALSR